MPKLSFWECQYSQREALPPNPESPPENDPDTLPEQGAQEGGALFSNQVLAEGTKAKLGWWGCLRDIAASSPGETSWKGSV